MTKELGAARASLEAKVFMLARRGMTNKEIAGILEVTWQQVVCILNKEMPEVKRHTAVHRCDGCGASIDTDKCVACMVRQHKDVRE